MERRSGNGEGLIDLVDEVRRAVEQLLGRASGPMHLRLVMQPVIATILAIRAGLRDAREGRPPFLWTVLTNPESRAYMLRSGWKDVGKVFTIALVLDTIYQLVFMRHFYLVQTLVVAVGVALVPYCLVRGPTRRIAGRAPSRA